MKTRRNRLRTSRSSSTAVKQMMEQLMELQRRKVFGLRGLPKLKLRPHRMSHSRMRKNLKKSKRKLKLLIKRIIRMMTLSRRERLQDKNQRKRKRF